MNTHAIRPRLLAASLTLLALVTGAFAQEKAEAPKENASGNFLGREWTFEVHGAYAFPGEVGMDDEPGIIVAVSNAGFNTERIDQIWDREWVLDNYHRDENTLLAYSATTAT
jgi:hypothetical protein